MPSAIIIDLHDTLTDEADNDRAAIALLRQVVAQAGVRVPEQALAQAEEFAVQSFAPNVHEAMIFHMVGRNPELGLRCITNFKKNRERQVKLREGAVEALRACKSMGWRTSLAQAPDEAEVAALKRAGALQLIDLKGPPPTAKVALPDLRVLEYLGGKLGVRNPNDCVMLGSRLDRAIRPANMLRMLTVQVHVGLFGTRQVPRDLKDVPTYEAEDLHQLQNVLPSVV